MLKDLVTSMTMLNGVSQDERQAWERFVKVYKDPMCEFARSQAALRGMSETEADPRTRFDGKTPLDSSADVFALGKFAQSLLPPEVAAADP